MGLFQFRQQAARQGIEIALVSNIKLLNALTLDQIQ